MEIMFVEAKSKKEISLSDECIALLPSSLALFTTVQHAHLIEKMRAQLEEKGKKVLVVKGTHAKYPGQLLGCSRIELPGEVEAILYVGTGNFHPLALLDRPVFVYNPFSRKCAQVAEEEQQRLRNQQKSGLAAFYKAEQVGVLISTKPGQLNMQAALSLEDRFKEKKMYYLVFNTLDAQQLENFPFVECFVNSACPRLRDDSFPKPMVNIEVIP